VRPAFAGGGSVEPPAPGDVAGRRSVPVPWSRPKSERLSSRRSISSYSVRSQAYMDTPSASWDSLSAELLDAWCDGDTEEYVSVSPQSGQSGLASFHRSSA
jgi:hypothetical protein